MRNPSFAARWVIYLIRWMTYLAYGCLAFVGKPGSRMILPALGLTAAWWFRAKLDPLIDLARLQAEWQQASPFELKVLAAIGVALAICVYAVISPRIWRIRRAASAFGRLLRFTLKLALLTLVVGVGVALYMGLPLNLAAARFLASKAYAYVAAYVPAGVADIMPSDPVDAIAAFDWQHLPEPQTQTALLIIGVLLASCAYGVTSRIMTLLLGAFPPITRPLPPLRSLKARNQAIRSVVVRIAVPKLPKPSPQPAPPMLRIEARPNIGDPTREELREYEPA